MHKRSLVCLFLAAACTAAADPPREGVAEANALMRAGQSDAALQAYRGMQVDDPESALLYYNIGCAELETASASTGPEDSAAAIESLNAAKASFDKASMAEDPAIRRDARYNRVNCDSLLAKQLSATDDFEAAKGAFEEAIYGYEDFLDQYPGHEGAEKNLNHMRYLLKKMLQEPPPEQQEEQQQDQSGEGEKNQDQQDQQSDDKGDQQDGEPQEQKGDQPSENEADRQQSGDEQEEQDSKGGQEQQQSDQDESKNGQSDADSKAGDEQDQAENSPSSSEGSAADQDVELPSQDTIDAILDALQERDKEEQQNMRRVPQNPRRAGPWW